MSFIASVLTSAADKFVETLAENVAGDLYDKIKGNPTRNAFKHSLGSAVERYATKSRLSLARPLLEKDGLLADEEIGVELAHLLLFDREPDLDLIGEKWKACLDSPPKYRNFAEEAGQLVEYLEYELRKSETFRSVFEAHDLNRIAIIEEESLTALEGIESQLESLSNLLDARLGKLLEEFTHATPAIGNQIRDFSRYVEEKTRGFVGRQWVFDAVKAFMRKNRRGYFLIIGDPGIGKSALSAQLAKQNGYCHHFNIRAEGINKARTFLQNICAQLIAAYNLEYTVLPPETTEDAGFLNKLLSEVSEKLENDETCVIVVDALDEVERVGIPSGVNLLYLPLTLPPNVYFVVTMQDVRSIRPRIDCEQEELHIRHNSSNNLSDVTDYVQASTSRDGIRAYIKTQKLTTQEFVDMMVRKSEGNFMYLRYVLPEMECGAYQDLALTDIPAGLQSYYEDHWRRMRGMDEDAWFDYKLPVLIALSVVQEPVSLDLIVDFSKVGERRRIRSVMDEWSPFIHEEEGDYNGGRQRRYRLYHLSFFDFISAKQEVADERVDLPAMNKQIADTLWEDLFGEGQ